MAGDPRKHPGVKLHMPTQTSVGGTSNKCYPRIEDCVRVRRALSALVVDESGAYVLRHLSSLQAVNGGGISI